MSEEAPARRCAPLHTAQIAEASGYSAQQVRDLERLGVIPPAARGDNNYRQFTHEHVRALQAYRGLATAVGPVLARGTLRAARELPLADAAARISALHVGLAKEREDALAALSALRAIQAEARGSLEEAEHDAMSITELADALGVRPSTLRFWEQEGILAPERVTSFAVRRYPPAAIREARITAALRTAGYRIPAVRETIDAIRRLNDLDDPVDALTERLRSIATKTIALLNAGADITTLMTRG